MLDSCHRSATLLSMTTKISETFTIGEVINDKLAEEILETVWGLDINTEVEVIGTVEVEWEGRKRLHYFNVDGVVVPGFTKEQNNALKPYLKTFLGPVTPERCDS